MTYYDNQAQKDNNLRSLLEYLVRSSNLPKGVGRVGDERHLGLAKAYDDAAARLQEILNTPVAGLVPAPGPEPDPVQPPEGWIDLRFHPQDMCVVVVTPAGVLGKDMPRALIFDEVSREVVTTTLSPLTRAIVGAMLDHTREQLDAD